MLAQRFRRFWSPHATDASGLPVAALVLVAAGVGMLATWRDPIPPSDDSAICGGAVDLALAWALQALPEISIASLLQVATRLLLAIAWGFFGAWLFAVTGSALVAWLVTLAAALSPAGVATLAWPSGAAALAAVSCALWAAAGRGSPSETAIRARPTALIVSTALATLAVPPFLLPLGLIAVATAWARRQDYGRRSLAVAAAAWVAAALAPHVAAPPLGLGGAPAMDWTARLACLAPGFSADALATFAASVRAAPGLVGPLPIALAAVGVLALLGARRFRLLVILGIGAFVALALSGPTLHVPERAVPLLAAFWAAVAIGLTTVADWMSPKGVRGPAALLLLALVPWLQLARERSAETPAAPDLSPTARLSANGVWQLLRGLPDGSLVREDSTTDMVLRALHARLRRAGRSFQLVAADRHALMGAMATGRVYVFAGRQEALRNRGFVLRDHGASDAVAEVVEVRPCLGLTFEWQSSEELTRTAEFALVAERTTARGPVIVLLASSEPPDAWPVGWPARTTRGFHPRAYVLDATVRERLASDGVPIEALGSPPHVQRLVLWRTPDAPLALRVALKARPTAALASLAPGADDGSLVLCPVLANR